MVQQHQAMLGQLLFPMRTGPLSNITSRGPDGSDLALDQLATARRASPSSIDQKGTCPNMFTLVADPWNSSDDQGFDPHGSMFILSVKRLQW